MFKRQQEDKEFLDNFYLNSSRRFESNAASNAVPTSTQGSELAGSSGPFFHECHNIARARDTLGPRPVEISDHVFEFVGGERGVEPRFVGKLVNSVVHALLRLTPEAPGLLAFEDPDGPRQMVGRIPMIEFRSQRCRDDRANDEKRLGHR